MVALGVALGGCFSETFTRGYILPEGALEQIPIGSTQEQVLIVLGTPSTVATLSGEAFYYISQRSERPIAFMLVTSAVSRRRTLRNTNSQRISAATMRLTAAIKISQSLLWWMA